MIPEAVEQAARLYVATFAGRDDAYSIWTGDQWMAVRRPLQPSIILKAFETKIPVSAYVLSPRSTTHLAVLDIDRDDGLELGKQAARFLSQSGGISYLEPSRRGCHLWIVLTEIRSAVMVRSALRGLIHEAGLPDDKKIELRPGSDHLSGDDSLGHCIRMPTMPHHLTGSRYVLVSGDGVKLPGKLVEMMPEIEACPVAIMDALAELAPLPPLGAPSVDMRHPFGSLESDESACQLLVDLWGADPSRTQPGKLIKCPAHPDTRPSLSILKDDQRAICYAAGSGCVLHNDGRGRGTHELRALAPRGGQP